MDINLLQIDLVPVDTDCGFMESVCFLFLIRLINSACLCVLKYKEMNGDLICRYEIYDVCWL